MAFVNDRDGAEKHETTAGAGLDIDFDPGDPDVVKVHYDLSAWTFDQRAEISEALATDGIPHAWVDDELVVPEEAEEAADAMFERLEEQLGPFPVGLADDEPATEFGLDEWSAADRATLTEALVEAEIPHRWDATTVFVAQDAEDTVDDLLDSIESGDLMSADHADTSAHAPTVTELSALFLASNKLVKDPSDAKARHTMIEMNEQLEAALPPYAFPPRTWSQVTGDVARLVERVHADADASDGHDDDGDDSDVEGIARTLRNTLRQYV